MSTVTLLLGIHHHQPAGNFEHVYRMAYDRCYRPFIDTLERHPGIRLTLHYTGPLLDWFEKEEPRFLQRLRRLVESRQVEILGGGFYEPILSVIPDRDAVGQVNLLSQRLRASVGTSPQGLWLAERVWDGHLPKKLAPTGLRYTIVDDSHFMRAGFEPGILSGYYLTEREGATLSVFPISKDLRYLIPFRMPEELIEFLIQMREHGGGAVTYADDGEKFGLWPGTYQWVYDEGYLERLFAMLEQHADWIEVQTFSEHMKRHRPAGRAYLPSASYEEMMQWSGGLWDKFFVKYPESNHLHKRMLDVSERIALRHVNEVSEARELLWKAQGNDVYWHGLFGGLYLSNLRHEAYRNLIAAECHLDHTAHIQDTVGDWIDVRMTDLDKDGEDEVLVSTSTLGLCLAPAVGGALLELDYRPARFNLLNVIGRRQEAYHQKLMQSSSPAVSETGPPKSIHDLCHVKEAGLDQMLIYDRHRRVSFMERFLDLDTTWESLDRIDDFDRGNCAQGRYELGAWGREPGRVTLPLTFAATAQICGQSVAISVEKTYRVRAVGEGVAVSYRLQNQSDKACEVRFGIELNLTLLAGDDPQRYYQSPGQERLRLRERGEYRGAQWFALVDEWHRFRVALRMDRLHDVWYAPVETVSQSEEGFERNYQGSAILLSCCLTLLPGQPEHIESHLEITEI